MADRRSYDDRRRDAAFRDRVGFASVGYVISGVQSVTTASLFQSLTSLPRIGQARTRGLEWGMERTMGIGLSLLLVASMMAVGAAGVLLSLERERDGLRLRRVQSSRR